MKAYLINAWNRGFMDVEYRGLADMQGFVGGLIQCAYRWPSGDTLYVDEEGMNKDPKFFFFLQERTDQPFAGNGLLVGSGEGDNAGPAMTMAQLIRKVRFGWTR